MRIALWLLLALISMPSCDNHEKATVITQNNAIKKEDNSFSIKGTIRGMDSGWIYFGHEDTTGKLFGRLDSAAVIHGRFEKRGEITDAEKLLIGVGDGKRKIFAPVVFFDL